MMRRTLASAVLAALVSASAPTAAQEARVPPTDPWGDDVAVTTRIGDDDPTSTAITISQARFEDDAASWVVISRDDAFPDALAGTPLLGEGPLLFTPTGSLAATSRSELDRVLAPGGRAYLLGGPAALSTGIEDELEAAGYDVVRLSGPGRLDTAAAVAAEVTRLYPDASGTVLVARAWGTETNPTAAWADSVTVGGYAAWTGHPVVLSDSGSLSQQAADLLAGRDRAVLLGGTAALAQQVADDAAAHVDQVDRVWGQARDGTAVRIMTELWGREAAASRITLINGYDGVGWAFGLAAAGLAADFDAPLLGVQREALPAATAEALTTCQPKQVATLVIGGTGVVTDDTAQAAEARDGVACSTPPDSLLRDFSFDLPLFDVDSAWNQRADQAEALTSSDDQILSLYRVMLGDWSTLSGYDGPATEWPYMSINMDDWSIPITRAGDGEQEVLICADDGERGWPNPKWGVATEGGPVTAPAPAGPVRPAGPAGDDNADGHLVIYDPATHIAYDYFAATPNRDDQCHGYVGGVEGTTIEQAGEVDFFDVRGPGVNLDGVSSARAAGSPLLAGMLLPEDVESGAFEHAFAIAIPGLRNTGDDPQDPPTSDWFYPASTTETDFFNTDPDAIAAGQRLRLKAQLVDEDGQPLDEAGFAPVTRMFLEALRTYGAYPVDNAGGFVFYAEDSHTGVLHLTDDEVNALIGAPTGTPLPEGQTAWQVVMTALGIDLEQIPLAVSPGDSAPDPETAQIEAANIEVVDPAVEP